MTVREIAAITNISQATIYRALKNPEKVSPQILKQIQEVIGAIEREPDKIHQVYVVLPHVNSFYLSFILELINLLTTRDIQVAIFISNDNVQRETDHLAQLPFSERTALIWEPVDETVTYAFLSRKKNRPLTVLLNKLPSRQKGDLAIHLDSREAIKVAVDTLVKEGNTTLLLLSAPELFLSAQDISEGFFNAVGKYANVTGNMLQASGNNWDSAYQVLLQNRDMLYQVDAVVSVSELLSCGLLRLAEYLGIAIPRDLRLVTFEYAPIFEALSISMIHFSPTQVAQKIADYLTDESLNRDYSVAHNFLPQVNLLGSEKGSR